MAISKSANDFTESNLTLPSLTQIDRDKVGRAGAILSVEERLGQLKISGLCNILLNQQAVLIAAVGEKVCDIQVLNSANYQYTKQKELVAFELSVDKRILEKYRSHLLRITLYNDTTQHLTPILCSSLLDATSVVRKLNKIQIEDIFPSIGFFGGGKYKPLALTINKSVRSVRIVIESAKAYLNIAGIEIFDHTGMLIFPKGCVVSSSSDMNKRADLSQVLAGQGFHSELETNPSLDISFQESVFISTLHINNRKDKWGLRAKHISVYIEEENQEPALLYSSFNDQDNVHYLRQQLAIYLNLSDIDDPTLKPSNIRNLVMKKLVKQYYEDVKQLPYAELPFLKQILSTWRVNEPESDVLQLELKLFAIVFVKETMQNFNYDLGAYSNLLRSQFSILFLEKCANYLRGALGLHPIQISKHEIVEKSMLHTNANNVMQVLTTLLDELAGLGYKPCLAYGTLLGAYRENKFIEHDDDVDILIELTEDEIDFPTALKLRNEFISKLDKEKYRIDYGRKQNLNIHVYDIASNIMIDVFPYWYENDQAILYMQRMELRGLDREIFASRNMTELYGHSVPIPANSEKFLLERYGETWSVSDRFHEWRWALKSESKTKEVSS